jgi:hypothetical protein
MRDHQCDMLQEAICSSKIEDHRLYGVIDFDDVTEKRPSPITQETTPTPTKRPVRAVVIGDDDEDESQYTLPTTEKCGLGLENNGAAEECDNCK